MQKLELVGFIKQTQVGVHKGRIVTPKGRAFMDKITVKFLKADKKAKPQHDKAEKAQKAESPEVKADE